MAARSKGNGDRQGWPPPQPSRVRRCGCYGGDGRSLLGASSSPSPLEERRAFPACQREQGFMRGRLRELSADIGGSRRELVGILRGEEKLQHLKMCS